MAQATLNGVLENDGGEPADCWFDWGASTSYGMKTPVHPRLTTGTAFADTITGLGNGVEYHFRAVAVNSRGTAYGRDLSFVTPGLSYMMTLVDEDLMMRAARVLS